MNTVVRENKLTINRFFDALNAAVKAADSDDPDRWAEYLSPQVIDYNKIIFGEDDAPGSAIEGFRAQIAAFGDTDDGRGGLFVEDLLGEDNRVVARLRVIGKHTGYHARMPQPTGRSCDVEQIWIFTLNEGRITEIRAVSDRLGMFLQLGWDWPTVD